MGSHEGVRKHYPFIDGIRGACALYVVFSHACAQVEQAFGGPRYDFNAIAHFVLSFFWFGHFAVGFFIVISGFCIFSNSTRADIYTDWPRFKSYAYSRARRILPPYLGCLFLYCAIVWFCPELQQSSGSRWDAALPIFQLDVLLSHVFLVHNFSDQWLFKIDPPMWSLGIEWWIYWITPLLILPIWQKRGVLAGVVSGFVYGYAISLLKIMPMNACSWYIGLFCLGIAIPTVTKKANWNLGFLLFLMLAVFNYSYHPFAPLADLFVGLSAFCLILAGLKDGWAQTVLSNKVLTKLGEFSYSTYLFHWIILTMIHSFGMKMKLSPNQLTAWNLLIGVPAAVLASYVFFTLFEKPTLKRRSIVKSNHSIIDVKTA